MKKYCIFAIAFLLVFPKNVLASYADIDNLDNSLKEPVYALIAEGAIQGYSDGTFRPQDTISVGEFAKILTVPIIKKHILPAVDPGEDYDNILDDLISGNIEGILDTADNYGVLTVDYNLNNPVTREQAVIFVAEAYKFIEFPINIDNFPFVDIDNVTSKKVIQRLFNEGIIQGRDNTHFVPDGSLTRAEASKILYRAEETFLDDVNGADYGWEISGSIIEITDVSPKSLMPGETATIIFTIKDRYTGDVIDVDLADVTVSVIEGAATVADVSKTGDGVFIATIQVDEHASEGHLNVQIAILSGRLYVTTTDDYFESLEAEEGSSDLRIFPDPVGKGDTAVIIAIPRDFHGDPVSGLTLHAFVSDGGGTITSDMTEDPPGSGIYTGEYTAGNIAGEGEIGVRIDDYGGSQVYYVQFDIK